MLPSTGYFKGINCPFYDSGLCERPYCHFRHVKKEPNNISGDGLESGNALLKLVSAAVQKVLQQTDTGAVSPLPTSTCETESVSCLPVSSKATYNPTPIAELNKINSELEISEESNEQKRRHIPVPYTPRKPASLSIKRPVDTNGSKLTYVAPVLYTPGSETAPDPYTPKGTTESTEKYLPGTEVAVQEYAPKETQNSNSKVNYIPSDKNVNKKKLLEYKPTKVKSQPSSVTYQPTPRSLVPCFSSDEEEPDTKKRKISNYLNGLDDLGPEFDILDQILDEEKSENCSNSPENDSSIECKENKRNVEVNNSSREKDDKNHSKSNKTDKDKSEKKHDKREKSKKKERSERSDKKEKESENRKSSTDKKSSHKSSSRDKMRHRSGSDSKSEKRSHSKSSSSSSKHSKGDSSRHSKNSTSDKRDSKKSDNSHRKTHSHSKESKEKKDRHKKHNSKSNSEDDTHKFEDPIEDEIYELSEPDEDDIALECKRIFEEYVPTQKTEAKAELTEPDILNTENEEYIPSKKRVSRTTDKNIKVVTKSPIKPDFKVNAAQAMTERLAKVREFHAQNAPVTTTPASVSKPESKSFIPPISNHSKIRIAHVPYASTMLTAKKTIPPKSNSESNNNPSTSFTTTQTVKKGTQRVAHLPSEKFIDRPGVFEPLGSKIPANIRSTYLNLMIDQCLKIYLLPSDAYARAQNEELTTSKKCSSVPIYKNSAVLAISRLKKEVIECNGVKKSGSDNSGSKPVAQGIVTKPATAGSWSIENKNKRNFEDSRQFVGANLYNNIKKWILTDEQLKQNGFPRPHTSREKGRAIIYGQNRQKPPKGFIRTCCRCKKEYTVDKKGLPVMKQDCIYHPNNKYRFRGEVKYQCCSQDESSDGCCIASSHVYEYVDFDNLKGYVKTLPPENVMDDYGVYSLDCEMCYTTQGLDLTRVTVIDSSCKVVYETLIKPLHPIIDYNTRYSGITEEQMANVKTTLLEVQATLLTMFNSKTILIGHSLESDFKALKLIHDTVIDTSVLFPHKMGPPYKRALRNLSSEHLKKIIQNSVDGHDSAEDATVCMELLMFKVKEDLKTR